MSSPQNIIQFPFLARKHTISRRSRPQTARTTHSGAAVARRAAKRSPILIWERKGNFIMNMVIIKTQNRSKTIYRKPHLKVVKLKILPIPGLV